MSEEVHPLYTKWVVWASEMVGGKFRPQEVTTLATAEDFWNFYASLGSVNDLKNNAIFQFFKEGCIPTWENCVGLKYLYTTKQTPFDEHTAAKWENLLLMLIGGEIELDTPDMKDKVLGLYATFHMKKGRPDRIKWELWSNAEISKDALNELNGKLDLELTGSFRKRNK